MWEQGPRAIIPPACCYHHGHALWRPWQHRSVDLAVPSLVLLLNALEINWATHLCRTRACLMLHVSNL